jgi:hypothetical protein
MGSYMTARFGAALVYDISRSEVQIFGGGMS